MQYNFKKIEQDAKAKWQKHHIYKVSNQSNKPKYYVLDMFPYPSGAGLHVGHPLGYIASDIVARYKRLKGFNVLHPMGFDAFGLPAEQYALETGQHPAYTTEKNIARYRQQLDNIGFSFDWDREVRTSDPKYYKWTQWIFLQLFNSWYDHTENRARPLQELISIFEKSGNNLLPNKTTWGSFDSNEWEEYPEVAKREILMSYRLAYLANADVWWCQALGTVLANDEVVNGVSERGGHPVEKKQMQQWFLRITAFADRLLDSLNTLDWSESMKEMQRNWIGKSTGAEIKFCTEKDHNQTINVFTTRPDTIFGVDFLVLAPEHSLLDTIVTETQKEVIAEYVKYVKSRSERERISEVKLVTGCFTGVYAIHPFSNKLIPIWISEYVLAGYGTGAIMAVPSGDDRDHAFAKYFDIPITNLFGELYTGEKAYTEKTGTLANSDFLTGLSIVDATEAVLNKLEDLGVGKRKVNYRLRDAGFSRQRYWGEPFPIVYIDNVPYGIDEIPADNNNEINELPIELPKVDHYQPGPDGQGPLANLTDWVNLNHSGNPLLEAKRETNTMPGYAGSSWYFLRYTDPHNDTKFASRKATDYWQQVDLYVGGTEHAVGHLLYSRMWTKALYDLGYIGFDEPFKKLLNQGMIQGNSRLIYYFINKPSMVLEKNSENIPQLYFSCDVINELQNGSNEVFNTIVEFIHLHQGGTDVQKNQFSRLKELQFNQVHVDVNLVDGYELNTTAFLKSKEQFNNVHLFTNANGKFLCKGEVEKMSKSKYNVVNPDDIVAQYGADTFRMYEMFLGPVEMSKPWDTKGIEGVHRFLKKFWRLYYDDKIEVEDAGWIVTNDTPTDAEYRILHKAIKKVSEDIEKYSFNTTVSQFMITVNELTDLGCHKHAILQPLAILIAPFAPHIAEELWQKLGNEGSCIVAAEYPQFEAQYLTENSKKYPIAINGKPRLEMEFALDEDPKHIENQVLADPTIQKWLEGKAPKKFIYVKGKMINIVV